MASKALSNQLAAKDAKKAETEKKKEVIKDTCKKYGACAFILAISLVANIVLTVLQAQGARHYCPDNWIGSNDKCYYFSKEEKDWNSSRYNCTSQHADLAEIDTAEKMEFLMRFKCSWDHWIGQVKKEIQTGQSIDGTVFKNWDLATRNEVCNYLNENGLATARCYTERKWICQKKMD
ncbi:C-type lectin domain family 2 member B [Camelus dromedarius]|uniref:C-type lectin domain family 2 member B isoform X2 n=4 Tax=Camelus TaxID=9836 RepID=A0A8B7KG52_CAMFR|nr:C-type lectin domain family 2 member B isoform X2 [Camelus ferus]XP_010944693.1 C-type lectin domain family 2 member B isoform X2 [Camelus bactrianus]XP_010944694.1 C-type lectin domain family 2 member B isoform X2 [Camelus bactrianus]XP_010989088.1 C-type lectin domain family 2 member B isoform X2 [Camelus dromedarius]XP_010989089.1 C-type lectin domain family 2 member B isoform X2 [Camelus dromedarius]XP_014421067.1 C-type lectin domain family 2 member B isoform X2 [Camelus ferus]XP_0312